MIVCNICEGNVAKYSLGINKVVYGLMPVEVGSDSFAKAEWVDMSDENSGMAKFVHDECLSNLTEHQCPSTKF